MCFAFISIHSTTSASFFSWIPVRAIEWKEEMPLNAIFFSLFPLCNILPLHYYAFSRSTTIQLQLSWALVLLRNIKRWNKSAVAIDVQRWLESHKEAFSYIIKSRKCVHHQFKLYHCCRCCCLNCFFFSFVLLIAIECDRVIGYCTLTSCLSNSCNAHVYHLILPEIARKKAK